MGNTNQEAKAAGIIIYVDNTKACPGNGSSATPYCNMQNAFNVVNAGDSIWIRTGTGIYDQSAVLVRSGTLGNPIIIEPDTGANFIIRNSNGANDAAIRATKASYITVQNLTFDGAGVNTSWFAINIHAIVSYDPATNTGDGANVFGIQILNNTFKNWGGTAAQASTGAARQALIINGGYCQPGPCPGKVIGAVVRGNTFDSNRQRNLQILHADNTLVENNTFVNAKCGRDTDTATNTVGIHILDAGANMSFGTIIRNNVFHDWEQKSQCGVPHVSGAYDTLAAIWCDVGPMSGVVEGNHVYNINQGDPGDDGKGNYSSIGILIEFHCWGGWVVRNNVVHDIGHFGIGQRLTGDTNPANWTMAPTQFLNNTVYNAKGRAMGLGAGNFIAKNNIVSIAGTSYSALMSPSIAAPAGHYDIDYNLYFDSVNGQNRVGQWGADSNDATTFTNWKSLCNCDQHSMFINPLLTNPAGGDFHLLSTSPAINAGATLSNVLTDFEGTTRPQSTAYDIGADEFGGAVSTPTPTPTPTSSTGPIAHWKLDETSGTTASDSAGTYPATLTNGPVWTTGRINNALSFDGIDDYATAATGPTLANQSFTVSAWAKRSSTGTDDWLFTQGTGSPNQAIIMGYRSNNAFTCAFYANDLDTSAPYTDTDWHLWTCTYDAVTNSRILYRDGVNVAQGTAPADYMGSGNTRIGSFQGTGFFSGLLDDVRIYNRALTPSEVQTLANPSSPTPTPTPGPVACHQYTPSTVIPTGFASPYDVVSSPSTNLMNVTCLNLTDARVDLGKGDPLQYIYHQGYLFKTGGSAWTPLSYTSTESLIAGAWYPKSATATISLTSTELSQPSYALTYLCSWTGSAWKCGCRDAACTQSYWMIQSFKR